MYDLLSAFLEDLTLPQWSQVLNKRIAPVAAYQMIITLLITFCNIYDLSGELDIYNTINARYDGFS